jgi:hypothetical protein
MITIRLGVAALAFVGASMVVTPAHVLAQKKQRDLITREEILASAQKETDLYQAIRSLRPHFLEAPRGIRTMGNTSAAPTMVYIDGTRESTLDALRGIMASTIAEVRYLDPAKAQNELGPTATGGAVMVKRYKGPTAAPRDTGKPAP